MKKILSAILLASLLFTSCSKDDDTVKVEAEGQLTLRFDAVFGNQDFALDKDFVSGTKTFNFSKFRYWVSNVALINTKGEAFPIPDSYFLIEETGAVAVQDGAFTYPAKKREDVLLKDIPIGDYQSIRFSVGVDSKFNDNLSLQSGELSQLNGMTNVSWMWMTSYIFSSVGGKVSEGSGATLASRALLVETVLNANYKTVSINLPGSLRISSAKESQIILKVDAEKVMDGVDIMTNPVVGASKANIMAAVATNYSSKVFSVASVK